MDNANQSETALHPGWGMSFNYPISKELIENPAGRHKRQGDRPNKTPSRKIEL